LGKSAWTLNQIVESRAAKFRILGYVESWETMAILSYNDVGFEGGIN